MKTLAMAFAFACSIGATLGSAQTASAANATNSRAESSPRSRFEQQLVDSVKQLAQANQRNDGNYFKRTLTDDFIAVPKNGGTIDRADFLEDVLGADKTQQSNEAWLYNIKVVLLGEKAALVTYDEILPGENPRYRHISDIWLQQADQWKLRFQQTTPNLWSIGD